MQLVASNTPCIFSVLCLSSQRFPLMMCVTYFPAFNEGWFKCYSLHHPIPFFLLSFLQQLLGMASKPHKAEWTSCIYLPSIPITLGNVPFPHFTWSYWDCSSRGLSPFILSLGGHIPHQSGNRGWFRNRDVIQAESLVFSLVDIQLLREIRLSPLGLLS